MVDQEITLGSSNTVTVTMQTLQSDLENVVVVGYQRIPKSKQTGSTSTVAAREIENRPNLSFDQALTGKAAGVQIGTSSGLIGDNVIIRIRGAASISTNSQPLIVLDGVPLLQGNDGQLYNPANVLADLNPNDIESIVVLKDVSSSALYGSRAAGGVLLITTKKGKSGKATLTYDGYAGYVSASRNMAVLNADQYNTTINKMRSNAGLANIAAYGDIDGNGTIDPANTDWQKEVYRNGFTQNHQLSLSGGADRTTYYASLGYNDFENYIIINRQKRISGRLNLTSKITNWLEIGLKSQYSRTTSYGLGSGTGGALSGVPFGPLTAYPNVPVYGPTGDYYTGAGGNSPLNNTPNPVAVQKLNFDTRESKRLIASAYAEALLIKGLRLKTQFNIDELIADTDQWWDPAVGDGSGLAGVAQTVNNFSKTWTWFNTLNYNTKIGVDHDVNLLAGSEYTRNRGGYSFPMHTVLV
jgi:TonB-linked SusC/RagA family outer membrane protein